MGKFPLFNSAKSSLIFVFLLVLIFLLLQPFKNLIRIVAI